MSQNNNDEDEMPKLDIHQENSFKKLKLNLEHGAIFPDSMSHDLPPEIEAMFLDSVMKFENAYKNVQQISIFEKIGKPNFIKSIDLKLDSEIEKELDEITKILGKHNIVVEMICEYEDKTRLLYTFITQELFNLEVDDVVIDGMNTHFIYEEFHPNHKYDLENLTESFLRMFLDKKSKLYKKYYTEEASNHIELNNFRSLFDKFKIKNFNVLEVVFDEKRAKITFDIHFLAKIKNVPSKITYAGNGSMTFKYKKDYWKLKKIVLPIMD
jgi:23S rRNA U2552 (ribose-2'-O)-methylase RlmE/FtsJ